MTFERPQLTPEEEQQIEKDKVSGPVTVRRLAAKFIEKLKEKDPSAGEQVTFVEDDEQKAA